MFDAIATLAKTIHEGRERLRKRIVAIRTEGGTKILKTKRTGFPKSVAAIDSGFVTYSMHGADIVAVRSAGAVFYYSHDSLTNSVLVSDDTPDPQVEIKHALDEHDSGVYRSLVRLKYELLRAIEIVEKYSPEFLFLDGSLLPLACDRPAASSELMQMHAEIIKTYRRLYETCDRRGTQLCGIVKDSRSIRFAKKAGFDCSDSVFFGMLLEAVEYSEIVRYFDEANKNTEKEFNLVAERIGFFYLKASKEEIPLRVEFLQKSQNKFDDEQIVSVIFSLSSISESFAYPAVLVEADLRAAINQHDVKHIESTLLSFGISPMRRDNRPFR